MKAEGIDVYSMCAGEPDFDTPQIIKDAAIEALQAGKTSYTPASGMPELRMAVAEKFRKDNGIDTAMANIVVAPGAKFFRFFPLLPRFAVLATKLSCRPPYWVSYPEIIEAAGAKMVVVQTRAENNFEIDPVDLESAVTPQYPSADPETVRPTRPVPFTAKSPLRLLPLSR